MLDTLFDSILEDAVDDIVDTALDNEEIELPPEEEDGIFADTPAGIKYDEEEDYEDPYIVYDVDEEEPIDNETESEDDEDFFVTEATLLGGYDSFDEAQLIQEAKKYLSKSEIMKDLERADNPTKMDKIIDKFYELVTLFVGVIGGGAAATLTAAGTVGSIGTSALSYVPAIASTLTVSMVVGVAIAIIARIIKMPVGSDPDKLRKCQRIEAGIDKGIKDLKAKKNKGKEDPEKIEKVIKELEEGKAKVHAKIEAINSKIDKEE